MTLEWKSQIKYEVQERWGSKFQLYDIFYIRQPSRLDIRRLNEFKNQTNN